MSNTIHLIGQGSVPDLLVRMSVHVVFTPSGPSVEAEADSVTCR